jgi:predicted  nucleic acid-binding Zn-ribbon protein
VRLAARTNVICSDSKDSKERVLARIKHNFYLETQSFRQRIHDATEEAARAKDEVDALQTSLVKWKKRCVKMQRKLEDKDVAMQQLQQRQDVQFPLLFDETLRSVQAHMDNQSDDLGSVAAIRQSLSHSAISEKARASVDNDERVHEYERQISALYEELEQEKQRNAMLSECLQDQKAEKHKFMKACKRAKLELQAVRDSGLSQMLADMEGRCAQLEQEKQCLAETLQQKQIDVRCLNAVASKRAECLANLPCVCAIRSERKRKSERSCWISWSTCVKMPLHCKVSCAGCIISSFLGV